MTAPDPRLDQIQARLDAAEPGPWFLDADGVSIYYVFHNGDTLDRDRLAESSGDDAILIANAPADLDFLLAELRKAHEALTRVEALAEAWRYKGEFGWGAWQEGYGPDPEGYVLDTCAGELRAAVAAAKGDEQ